MKGGIEIVKVLFLYFNLYLSVKLDSLMFFYTHIISNPNPFLTVNCENEHNKNTTTEYKSKQEMLVLPFYFRSMNKDLHHSTAIIVKCLID